MLCSRIRRVLGFHVRQGSEVKGLGDGSPLVGSRGKAKGEGLGTKSARS